MMKQLLQTMRCDLECNKFWRPRFVVVFFRLANFFATHNRLVFLLGSPVIALYIFIVEWVMGIEIPPKTRIGKGLTLFHGYGLVINGYSEIGEFCVLRQGVTIGNIMCRDGSVGGTPSVGNHVEFGANACVLGDVDIGNHARIGAGAVVLRDVPAGTIAVGVPARILSSASL